MVRQRSGRIINVSSASAAFGTPGQANYVASKAGAEGLTRTTANELASRGITVNAVAYGYIETPLTEGLKQEQVDAMRERTPLKGKLKPEDAAEAVLWLASDRAAFVTGQVFHVDGGMVFSR